MVKMSLGTIERDRTVLTEYFGEHPLLKILEFLIENKIFDYSKKQMADETGLSKVTFLKYFKKMEELGLVTVTRSFGKSKLYTLNETNPFTKKFIDLTLSLANYSTGFKSHEEKVRLQKLTV